jgi:hypothetical protein
MKFKKTKTIAVAKTLTAIDIDDLVSEGLVIHECGLTIESGALVVNGCSCFNGDICVSGTLTLNGGQIIFDGSSTVWDDLQIPGYTANRIPSIPSPSAGSAMGNMWLSFFTGTESVYFNIQMPHSWKEGSTIYPHVHAYLETSATLSTVIFGLEYTWHSSFSCAAFPAPIIYNMCATVNSNIVAGSPLYINGGLGITPPVEPYLLSSLLICRLYRQSAANNCPSRIGFISFDVHYEMDTIGSREENHK